MKVTLSHALAKLPRPSTAEWPDGVFDTELLAHGTMSLDVFAPTAEDRRQPRHQDALYIVAHGSGSFMREGDTEELAQGDAVFVRAGDTHRFETMSDDLAVWVVTWGPEGGEAPSPQPSVFAAIDA